MMAKLSSRQREALECLGAVPEGILRGTGALAAFVFDNQHLCYLMDAERLARQKLCEIDEVGESAFIRITPKGRAAITTPKKMCCYVGVMPTFRCPGCPHDALSQQDATHSSQQRAAAHLPKDGTP